MVTDHAARCGAKERVVGGMAGDTADDGSLDAAFCIGRSGRDRNCQCRRRSPQRHTK
jgi:hypothetical protein